MFIKSSKLKLLIFYLLLIGFCCFPIWTVEFYVNQDGSAHLYNAYLIDELLKNNSSFKELFSLNYFFIPNQTGHWLIAFFLLIFSPAAVTKIIVTFTFAAFVAAVGWLRLQVAGARNLATSLLLGAVLGFNWMWFLGFYNFAVGVILFAFTLGLFWRWRDRLDFRRGVILSGLLILTFLSHLISFGMLAGSFLIVAFFNSENRKDSLRRVILILLPVVPMFIAYKIFSETGGELSPVWRELDNPLSVKQWLLHLSSADPFQLISRRAFPFSNRLSPLFGICTPFLWIFFAFAGLTLAGYRKIAELKNLSPLKSFLILFFGSIIFWIFAPDDFGKLHGGILRERVLLLGLICFVPLFSISNLWLKRISQGCLVFVLLFQTAVLLEYTFRTDTQAREYFSAANQINNEDSIGSVILLRQDECRYKSIPLVNMTPFIGIGKETRIWDNYEAGYYLFPVILNDPADRRFAFEFHETNVFPFCDPNENIDEKINQLDNLLAANPAKLDKVLVWGEDAQIDSVLKKYFPAEPVRLGENLRLFRLR